MTAVTSFKPVRNDPHPKYPPDAAEGITITEAGMKRPRLMFTLDERDDVLARLEDEAGRNFFEFLKKKADGILERPIRGEIESGGYGRGSADGLGECGLAFYLTEDERYLDWARKQLVALSKSDGKEGNTFAGGHMLTEIGWCWDFISTHLSEAEKASILPFVADLGTASISRMLTPLDYSGATPLHNITICAWSGIGIAGLAFHDEFPKARVWAEAAQRMFRAISWMHPPDGSGIEGPQYSVYGFERKAFYYEAARRVLGEDLYGPGMQRTAAWVKSITKPTMVGRNNAFPWQDNGPYFDAHGPVYSLLALARHYQDPKAQAVALKLWSCGVGHGSGMSWTNFAWYDHKLKPAEWEDDETASHAEDLDMISARSSWKADATAVSFACGPYQGHRAQRIFPGDPGGSHHHADTASFQVCSRGSDLLTDPGYEHIKRTSNHNTLLVNGLGQLGEGLKWFNVNRVAHWNGTAEVLSFRHDGDSTAWVGEAHKMYVPEAGLQRFHRHMLYLKPDLVVVLDDLAAEHESTFTQLWHGFSEFKKMDAPDSWGQVHGHAAMSLIAIRADGGSESIDHEVEFGAIPDLTKFKDAKFSTLRLNHKSLRELKVASVIGIGPASDGPPKVDARLNGDTLEISSSPVGAVRISFDLKEQQPPQVVS